MKNLFIPIALGVLCTSFAYTSPVANPTTTRVEGLSPIVADSTSINHADAAAFVYTTAELQSHGLSKQTFDYAWKGYQYLLAHHKISKSEYLTICDFSQSSRQKRLYIIDVINGELVRNTWVAHGKNSGAEYATHFSNKPESLETSLGFYITSATYNGEHGLSLRINGVDPGFNDKALERSIVIHGATYVDGARVSAGMYMGRSWGCPAVPQQESAGIISTIKNGSCLFIYHPTRTYLLESKILND